MNTENKRVFAFIAEGDVFHILLMPDEPDLAGVLAGLNSKPLLVEVTDRPEIYKLAGWKYDYETETFYHPAANDDDVEEFVEDDYEVED